jgi:membrane fusion protein (multidrug efflux system)
MAKMQKTVKRILAGAAIVSLVGGAGWAAVDYRTSGRFLESTDDAYVKADYTTIAPKVSGYVAEVLVRDNQQVSAGQVLARIDDADFKNALAQASADVSAGEAAIGNIRAQIDQQQQVIAQAQAGIEADLAARTFALQDVDRYRALMKTGFGTVQRAQQAEADIQQKSAAVQRDRAALAAAQQETRVLQTALAKAQAALQHDQAVAGQAELNLGYTTITAPIAGTVGNRTLRVGQYVQAGTQLMAVVPLQSVYVVGNFKETQLTYVRAGQHAEIAVDSFPGVTIRGHVDSVAPAAGQEFSLLPPDNATGNFTKIVQRIPVKIVLDADDPLANLLRPGMSVESTIDTKLTVLAQDDNPVPPVKMAEAKR